MSNDLLPGIREAAYAALRDGAKQRLGILRLVLAALQQREIDEKIELEDAVVVATLEKMIRQRREALEHFQRARRQDLAAREEFEIATLLEFMPSQLSEEQVEEAVAQVLLDTQARSLQDMSRVMDELRKQLQGRTDISQLGKRVKEILENL